MPKLSYMPLRVPSDVPKRSKALVEYVEKHEDIGRMKSRVTQADVLRMAVDLGLRHLEARAGRVAYGGMLDE